MVVAQSEPTVPVNGSISTHVVELSRLIQVSCVVQGLRTTTLCDDRSKRRR
jgi:hypothetical protein